MSNQLDSPIPYPTEYREYFRLFNERDFFEAHEVLEDLWVIEVEPLKMYYKGLIQAAVAICHWERGNISGARRLYLSASGYLSPYPEQYEGFALGDFRRCLHDIFAPLKDSLPTPPPELIRDKVPFLILRED